MRSLVTALLLAAAGLLTAQSGPEQPKSALDKVTFETYVRHLFVWGPEIQITIGDPKPSELPGMLEVGVHAQAGMASADQKFYVTKDGRRIVQGAVYDVTQNPFKPELDKLKTEFQPSLGTPGAPVVLVLFTDFQCPFCKEEAKMLRQNLLSAYPKEVRLYLKDFPLDQMHNWARGAAIAGRCIFRQNPAAFWDYHDWIFEHQLEIKPDNLKAKVLEFAQGKDIDSLQLTRCLDTRATESEVDKSVEQGKNLQVAGTPTLFVNGRRIATQLGWPQLRGIIDYEIQYQKTAKNAGEDCNCEVKLPSPLSN